MRRRLSLLSVRTTTQIEVKCFSFFVLSVSGAALCMFCQCPRSSAPLLHGHPQSTCWNQIDLRGYFDGVMLQSLKQHGWLLSRWWESLLWASFQYHLQLDLVRIHNLLLSFMIHLGICPAWPVQHMYGLFLLRIWNCAQNMYPNFVPSAELYVHFCICTTSTIYKYLTCAQSGQFCSRNCLGE